MMMISLYMSFIMNFVRKIGMNTRISEIFVSECGVSHMTNKSFRIPE